MATQSPFGHFLLIHSSEKLQAPITRPPAVIWYGPTANSRQLGGNPLPAPADLGTSRLSNIGIQSPIAMHRHP